MRTAPDRDPSAAACIGAALGRPLPVREVGRDEAVERLRPAMGDHAEWYVDTVLGLLADAEPAPNRLVEEVTGRPATTFAQWARRHADDFR